MVAAEPAEPGDAEEVVSEEEDAEKLTSASKKKKKKKKKNGGYVGEVLEAATQQLVEPEESEEQSVSAAAQEAPTVKDEVVTKETPSKSEAAGEDDEDDDDEEGEEKGPAATKKKKKKKKKPAGGGAGGSGGGGASSSSANVQRTGGTDEEFADWCSKTLGNSLNGTEKMSPEDLLRPPKAFWGYKFSGELRPAYVSKQLRMPEQILKPDYALDPDGVAHSERTGPKEVPILEGENLKKMREACDIGREVLDVASRFMRAGVTGDEIDRIVFQACIDRNCYPSPLNYFKFPKSVCVSPNEVICHGIPDGRAIQEGDIVNLDVSIYHKGFHADLNETFFIGECDEQARLLVNTAYCALHAACRQIKPGTFYRDLGNAIHGETAKNGCTVVTTYCGHGVGELFHGPPKVPHYRKNKAVGIMKPGHVFTVEPMINLGSNGGDKTWPDNWTAVTRDGKRSAQFEHTFLVTETGVEVLTARKGTDRAMMPDWDPAMFSCPGKA